MVKAAASNGRDCSGVPGHHGYEPVVLMRSHRPFYPKNGRCLKEGGEKPLVVSDFLQQIENAPKGSV